jgi:hypothetical protein
MICTCAPDVDGHADTCPQANMSCEDCGTSTFGEYYMVHDEVWADTGMAPDGGLLCVGCLERRLGRRLTPDDFTSCPLNKDNRTIRHYASERLYDRIVWHQLRLFDVGEGDAGNVDRGCRPGGRGTGSRRDRESPTEHPPKSFYT